MLLVCCTFLLNAVAFSLQVRPTYLSNLDPIHLFSNVYPLITGSPLTLLHQDVKPIQEKLDNISRSFAARCLRGGDPHIRGISDSTVYAPHSTCRLQLPSLQRDCNPEGLLLILRVIQQHEHV